MLSFAYGSTMDWDQMRSRCPGAGFRGVAELRNHPLAFTRRSRPGGWWVADDVPAQGESVWGVVYDIPAQDISSLDKAEGYQPGRLKTADVREEQPVYLIGHGEKPLPAAICIATKEQNPPLPNQTCKDFYLKAPGSGGCRRTISEKPWKPLRCQKGDPRNGPEVRLRGHFAPFIRNAAPQVGRNSLNYYRGPQDIPR